ncbi:hypothetical protein HJ588_02200 [Flexivirga sp. ID2601S]|uniref:Diacylglycerol O-acyltransferase n=1 Tax=Flexivirga aerilata TaxID=1656889 RepID=A0A849AET5_9MICO|nr:hypothetical protein [Flexivirga aerilata]NNG38086.1 hypothetical protein [Flexivirga aerilata]
MSDVHDNRFTFGDEAYFLSGSALGIPVASQHTWRLPQPLPAGALAALHDNLTRGPLSRLAVPAGVPAARHRWVPAPAGTRLTIDEHAVPPDALMRWCDERLAAPIDPLHGPAWWLSATPITDGGQLVSFVTHHTIGDGGLILQAIDAAVTGATLPRVPGPHDEVVRLRDDARDAGRQLRAAGRGLVGAVRAARAARAARSDGDGERPARASVPQQRASMPLRADRASSYVPAFVAVDLSAAAWRDAAAARGGTGNSLLLMLSAGLVVAAGLAQEGDTIGVAMPVRLRGDGDYRSNVLGGASVPVQVGPDRYRDLRRVRAATKKELTRATDPDSASVMDRLEPVVRLLPKPVLRKIVERMPASLVSVSNVGRITPEGSGLGGPTATSMMCRGVHRNITPDLLRAAGGGVTTWLQEFGDRVTLTVEALDPDRIPDRDALAALVTGELDRWGLTPLDLW